MIALERRNLTMAFGDWGSYANRANLLSECGRFLKEEATRIVDDMTAKVDAAWYAVCRQAGVSERDCELIRSAFVYEGFGYDLSGRLEVTVDGERRILGPGDAYYFESRRPHRFRCVGAKPCDVISTCTPPTF